MSILERQDATRVSKLVPIRYARMLVTPFTFLRGSAAVMADWALALAHAKSGDAAMIAGYCGNSDALDEAVGQFALAYSKQTEQDHAALDTAQRSGRIKVAAEKDAGPRPQ